MLRGISKELWEAAMPKLNGCSHLMGNPVGIPMIFGTGGSDNFKNEIMGSWINEPMTPDEAYDYDINFSKGLAEELIELKKKGKL